MTERDALLIEQDMSLMEKDMILMEQDAILVKRDAIVMDIEGEMGDFGVFFDWGRIIFRTFTAGVLYGIMQNN